MHVRCLSRPLFVTIFENFVSAVCHVRCLSRNFQKVMSRVRCLSRNLVSAVCHVHCLSQKSQKIMSRVRCLSWLVKNPRVNSLSRFCHRFVTFLWRLYQKFVSIRFKTAKTTWGCTRTWTRTKSKSWHKHGHEHKQKSWHGYCQKIFNYLERIIYVLDKDFYQLLCI